jgi:hypothetical protein
VAADNGGVLPAGQHGLHEAPLAERSGEGFQLLVPDASRVGRIGVQGVDGYLVDVERGERGRRGYGCPTSEDRPCIVAPTE